MNHSVRVRVVQSIRDSDGHSHCFLYRKLFLPRQTRPQCLAVDKRHDVVKKTVCCTRIEQRQKIRMLKVRCNPDLGEKPLFTEYRTELRIEKLQSDMAVMPQILREINRRHSAGADLPLYVVAVSKRVLQLRERVHDPSMR